MHDSPELSWVYWDKAIIIPMLITWKNNNIVHHDGVQYVQSQHCWIY